MLRVFKTQIYAVFYGNLSSLQLTVDFGMLMWLDLKVEQSRRKLVAVICTGERMFKYLGYFGPIWHCMNSYVENSSWVLYGNIQYCPWFYVEIGLCWEWLKREVLWQHRFRIPRKLHSRFVYHFYRYYYGLWVGAIVIYHYCHYHSGWILDFAREDDMWKRERDGSESRVGPTIKD